MEELQLRLANTSDMKERAKIRTAIRNLRMKEEEGSNESPLSRHSFRRSRRLKNLNQEEQNLGTVSTNNDETKMETNSNEQGSGVEVDEPQNFIRNSSIRRNRRSRNSRTSRSSDQELDCSSPGYTNMDLVVEKQGFDRNSKPNEILANPSPAVRNTHSEDDNSNYKKNQATYDGTTGKGLSERGYIRNIHRENELPKNTTVKQTQGATCQYNTIRTSFREPKWNPVSTPNKLPTHRQSLRTQSANINNNNKEGWTPNRASYSAHAPEVAFSSGDGDSSKLHNHQKNPARTVLKALSRKLFSAKPKSPSASGHQIPTTPTVRPTSEIAKFFPTAISTPKSHNTSYPVTPSKSTQNFHNTSYRVTSSTSTPKSHNTSYPVTSSRPSPFQERKKVFEQKDTTWKPTWGAVQNDQRHRTDKRSTMADVMSLSRPDERATGNQQREEPEAVSDENEVGDSSVEELESLLKQYKDIDKRVKIRETIRLLKESLREEDTSASGSPTSADNSPASGTTPTTHKSVLTFTASSQRKEAQDNTPFSVSIEKTQPSSRFVGRCTSLRASKPSYTPPAEAIHRASSFKLSRPKDFIVKKVDSASQLAKVSEEFRDYADTLNNNVPKYDLPTKEDSSNITVTPPSSSHNKTASPFSVSPKSSFRKTTWTPPILQKSSSNTSLAPARSVQVTSLRRSESTKENRSSDILPIPIVRGNVRRSKSILGRILGQKIGLEKEPLTAAFTVNPSATARDKFLDSTPKESVDKSVSPIPESCLLETPNLEKDSEIRPDLSKKSHRCENSSGTSSVSEEEHVYEINNETDNKVTFSNSSEQESEIVQSDKKSASSEDHEKFSESIKCDGNAELESEVFEVFGNRNVSSNETVELLKVEIVAPTICEFAQEYNKEIEDKETKSENQEHKETRLSSSNSSAELSDDEDSSPEDDNMDRFSTRALQSRVSVKSQILATEGSKTNVTSPRRLRERSNKPLNTGDDVKSRIQKYKVKLDDGEIEQIGKKTQRNGGIKVTGASEKKLDTAKFETDRENVKITTPSSGKTIVTSTGTKSSNGFSSSSAESDRKTRNSSSSSATDDTARQRRTRRSKAAESENGTEKLEKASVIAISELKNSKITSGDTISTKASRERATKEDVNNNNTKADRDVAPPNENVEVVIEDSLSNWSARRRKKREKTQNESPSVTSGTENDKSSEDTDRPKESEPEVVECTEEPEPETIPTIKHVPHSEPVLSNMDADLHGYSFKLSINDNDKHGGPKDETKEEIHNDSAKSPTKKRSRVRSRYSRSSETRSSTSSNNDVVDNTQDDAEKNGLVLKVDNGSTTIEMEAETPKVEISANNNADISDENIDDDVIKEENVNERTAFDKEESELEDRKETETSEIVEDDKETKEDEKNETEVTSRAEYEITQTEEIESNEDEQPDKITQNKDFYDEKVQPTQTDEVETEQTSDTVYKEDTSPDEVKLATEPEIAATQDVNDEKVEKDLYEPVIKTPPEQAVENTEISKDSEKKHKKRHKETKEASEEGEKSERRHRRKKDKTSDDKTVEDEKPKKRRHRKKSSPDEEGKVVETEKAEEVKDTEKKTRKHKERKEKKSTSELPKEDIEEEKSEKAEVKEEKPKSRKHKEKEVEKSTPELAKDEIREQKSEKVKNKEEKPKTTEKSEGTVKSEEKKEEPAEMHYSYDNLEKISDIKLLEKMLESAEEYEQRRQIRKVIRDLKKGVKPTVEKHDWKPRNGSAVALRSKENQKDSSPSPGDLALRSSKLRDDAKESRFASSKTTFTKTEKTEFGSKYTSAKIERTTMTSGQKKIGSIFDRGDDEEDNRKSSRTSGSSRVADLERRQAERRRELQRNRSMPAASSKDARKAFVAKLEASAPKTQAAKKVGRSPTFVVPNANNVKQLLLKWCQSKTRGYEHVDIMNFSSSWASGMAFCALVHRFFPEAFDYEKLDPKNRAENFDLAFKSAEKYGDVAPLLEVEDMIIMGNRPDSKCVFTYVQFLYNHLKKFDQPLVPIKKKEEPARLKLSPRTVGESEDL